MVRLVVRLVKLQQMQPPIDRLDQPRTVGEKTNRPDPTGAQSHNPVGKLGSGCCSHSA